MRCCASNGCSSTLPRPSTVCGTCPVAHTRRADAERARAGAAVGAEVSTVPVGAARRSRGLFDRRSINLAHRLYDGALACRIETVRRRHRRISAMVREVAEALGKQVRLEITGEATKVDTTCAGRSSTPPLGQTCSATRIITGSRRRRARAARKPSEGSSASMPTIGSALFTSASRTTAVA